MGEVVAFPRPERSLAFSLLERALREAPNEAWAQELLEALEGRDSRKISDMIRAQRMKRRD